jgi:multidrug efflux pump subunit AcrA (membrane-fusion protein)
LDGLGRILGVLAIAGVVACIAGVVACGDTRKKREEGEIVRVGQEKEEIVVKAVAARRAPFNVELVSNGKVAATRKAVINFPVNDIVTRVHVKNGDRVRRGEAIVGVDDRKSRQALEEARANMDRIFLDVRMDAINEGVSFNSIEDTALLHPERRRIIFLQRGFYSQHKAVENAVYDLEHVTVKAPFDGVVADLEVKEFNHSSAYKSACMVIDDEWMEVIFNVLETEIRNLEAGMEVEITPYADHENVFAGRVTEVNPRVDENGMVRVKAVTRNRDGGLVDGMNVSLLVKRRLEEKLIVPKSAVLPRQGRKVVFVYEGGKAIWRYVTTGRENSKEVCIEDGLAEGDLVIHENNLGLSHQSDVKL